MSMPGRRQSAAVAWTAGEDRLRLLLDGAGDHAIVMLGPQGMVLTWNAGAVHIHGYAGEEIIGQHFSVFYPPEAVAVGEPQAHLEAALAQDRYDEEGWRIRRDGSRFWASVVITRLRDRSGRLRGFGMITRDLSDRLRAQDLLAVLDAASDAILGVDAAGRVMFTNSAAARMFGYPRQELVGRPVDVLLPHAVGGSVPGLPPGRPSAAARPGRRATITGHRQDGSTFPAEVSLSSVDTPRGRVVTATVRDVTQDRATAEALRMSGERLRVLFENSPIGQCEATLEDQRIITANRSLARLLGYEREELVGRRWPDLVDPDSLPTLRAEIEDLAAGRTAYYEAERMLVHRSGRPVPALVAASIIRDGEGRPVRLVGAAVDNTDRDAARRAMEHSLARARRLEEEHSSTKDVFATLLAATTEQIIIGCDAGGRISFVNRGAELKLGYAAAELLGRRPQLLHDPAELAAAAEEFGVSDGADALAEMLRRGVGAVPRQWTYLTKDGRRRPVWLTITKVGDPADPQGYIGVAVDAVPGGSAPVSPVAAAEPGRIVVMPAADEPGLPLGSAGAP